MPAASRDRRFVAPFVALMLALPACAESGADVAAETDPAGGQAPVATVSMGETEEEM